MARINTTAQPTITKPVAAQRKRTTTEAPKGLDQRHAADVDEESVLRDYLNNLKAQFKLTWTRERVIGMVLGLAVSFCTGYVIGIVLALIMSAVLAATGSMFLVIMIFAIGVLIAMWAGGKLGGAVFEYVGSGAAREHITSVGRTIRGWFSGPRDDYVSA